MAIGIYSYIVNSLLYDENIAVFQMMFDLLYIIRFEYIIALYVYLCVLIAW